ncbi:HNH endonuclease signature motif containing protein [Krasilnikovia cinnamomea]|uniref:HNH endonuclease signature motif containing protein n=1 Tax=Krasilnikovia cinnamomea TaxID=349313 RepID=UPI003BF7FB58
MRPGLWKNEAKQNPGQYSPGDLERMQAGKAPIGDDGFPMEIHHRIPLSKGGTNEQSNFVFLTRTQHRLGENIA